MPFAGSGGPLARYEAEMGNVILALVCAGIGGATYAITAQHLDGLWRWLARNWRRLWATPRGRVVARAMGTVGKIVFSVLALPFRLVMNVVQVAWSWDEFRKDLDSQLGQIRGDIEYIKMVISQLPPGSGSPGPSPAGPLGPHDPPEDAPGPEQPREGTNG